MQRMPRALSLGLVLLAGCAVGPDYQRPEIPAPGTFRGAETTSAGAGSVADLGWWEVFQDRSLQALIRTALANNKDLRLAAARVEEARGALLAANGEFYPLIAGSASYQRARVSELGTTPVPPSVRNPAEVYAVGGSASYELDFWGGLRRQSEAARAQLLAGEAAQQTVRASLVADVAATYFDLVELDSELAIARRTLESRQKSLQLVKARNAQGVVSKLDVRQVEGLVSTAAKAIPTIERSLAVTENRLSLLLGQNPGEIQRTHRLADVAVRVEVPAGLPSQLLERRPDLRAAEQQLIAANARVGVAKAAFFPTVALTASAGQLSADLSNLFKGPAGTWSFNPVVTVPIFTGGQLRGQYVASQAQREQALIAYERAVQSSFADVANALISNLKFREIRAEQDKLLAALSDAARLSNLRYRGGVTSYLEVLDSERQLFDAEIGACRAQRDELVGVVQLYLALGGGWQVSPASARP